ncbi:MAG: response regulator [Eubacteriales bacterium]
MNIVYSNLKITLWTNDEDIRSKLEELLSEHRIWNVDPEITPDALAEKVEDNRSDFVFLDADMGKAQILDRLDALQNAHSKTFSVVLLTQSDQSFVFELKESGADVVIKKECVSDQLMGYMNFLLEHKEVLHDKPESTIHSLGHVARLLLTNSPKDAIHLLMGYFVR